MKTLLLVVSLFLVTACGEYETVGTQKSDDYEFEIICLAGVEYYVRRGGRNGYMAVKFTPDSKVTACSVNSYDSAQK